MPASPPTTAAPLAEPRSPMAKFFRRSRSRPQLSVAPPPPPAEQEREAMRPKSPSVILSPSTPDFPLIGLPPLPTPQPTTLVPSQLLPLVSSSPSSPVLPSTTSDTLEATPRPPKKGRVGAVMDPTVRNSLALLDCKFAEFEQLAGGAGGGQQQQQQKRASSRNDYGLAYLRGEAGEEEERLNDAYEGEEKDEEGAETMAGLSTLRKDTSINSLSSLTSANSSSEEDAFDIADFPSLAELSSNFDLSSSSSSHAELQPTAPLKIERKRSSDLMAFPAPPALPGIPLRRPSAPVLEFVESDDNMFEQLVEMGQQGMIQGLGLFSSVATTVESEQPSPLISQNGRSRSSSVSSASSVSSNKSFDASTLASTAANTSWGQRDNEEEPFPRELTSTLPLFTSPFTSQGAFAAAAASNPLPQPLDSLTCNVGSAHPALASPFEENLAGAFSRPHAMDSPVATAVDGPALVSPINTYFAHRSPSLLNPVESSTSSPVSSGQASPHEAYFARDRDNRLGALDGDGIPTWTMSPASLHEELEELIISAPPTRASQQQQHRQQSGPHDHIRIIEPAPPPSPSMYGREQLHMPSSPSTGAFGTLRRLSSFGLLKKRKSEGVLNSNAMASNVSSPTTSSAPFGISKRKSEAALSSYFRGSKSNNDKENAPALPSPSLQSGPNKLSRRSVSSPKLNKLFGSPTSSTVASPPPPPVPSSPTSMSPEAFAARPRTLSFGESGEEMASSSMSKKKRFSQFFNQSGASGIGGKDSNGETVPPLPPTPKEHLAAKARAPAGIVIDVAKANELEVRKAVEQSPAPTLEITATPTSAADSLLFNSNASPAESAFPETPISPVGSTFSRAAIPVADRSVPISSFSEMLSPDDAPFSPTSSLAPASKDDSTPLTAEMSLAHFMKATDPDQQFIVKRPARTSSFFVPSSIFPPPSSTESSSRAVTPSTAAFGDDDDGDADWSRPTSPALLNALKTALSTSPLAYTATGVDQQPMAFGQNDILAFPMHIPPRQPPPMLAGDESASSGEDDYGAESEDDSDEDDKPLGVVVPGALTAQKSLRITAAKERRKERKAKEQRKRDDEVKELATRTKSMLRKKSQAELRKEDPFELEQQAAMVATPPMSHDGHGEPSSSSSAYVGGPFSRLGRPALSPIHSVGTYPSSSTITSLQSGGHDSLLPQTDASVERRQFSSLGMKRSNSIPLDPMIANSSLIIDSPPTTREPLPSSSFAAEQRRPSLQQTNSSSGRSRSGTVTRAATVPAPTPQGPDAPPMPTMRPPPAPPSNSLQQPPALARRPSLHPTSSSHSSPTSSPATTPQLGRRPSLLPEGQQLPSRESSMNRQASSASSKSNPHVSLSRQNTLANRTRTGTSSSPSVTQKIYLDAECTQHVTVSVNERTVAGEVVSFAKGKGALAKAVTPKEVLDGGWALWEVWRSLGIERPVREYEFINDITKSWDENSAVFIFRRTPLWPILSSHARLHTMMPKTGPVQLEVKKGKWSKRFLSMDNGALTYSKSEKGKDSSLLCQLTNFDVFFVTTRVAETLKAPKPFVFALKSRLTRAQFIEESEWLHYLSTKTADETTGWVKSVLEAGNMYARQREQAVLGATSPTTSSFPVSGPLIPSSAFVPADAPPVPSIPPTAIGANTSSTVTPAAALAASVRTSSRPPPPMLAQRSMSGPLLGATPSQTLPVPVTLTRQKTVSKPTTREWGSMGPEEKHAWTKESERLAKSAKQPLLELSGR